jgi:hypothetical protein
LVLFVLLALTLSTLKVNIMKKQTLYIDQYGTRFWAYTRKELVEKVGGGKVFKMYRDKKDGPTVCVGYVIGNLWLTAYACIEIPV